MLSTPLGLGNRMLCDLVPFDICHLQQFVVCMIGMQFYIISLTSVKYTTYKCYIDDFIVACEAYMEEGLPTTILG